MKKFMIVTVITVITAGCTTSPTKTATATECLHDGLKAPVWVCNPGKYFPGFKAYGLGIKTSAIGDYNLMFQIAQSRARVDLAEKMNLFDAQGNASMVNTRVVTSRMDGDSLYVLLGHW